MSQSHMNESQGPSTSQALRLQSVADDLLETFIERLTAEAALSGGHLVVETPTALNAMAQDLFEDLNAAFRESLESQALAESPQNEARRDVFRRLLVGEFAFLFPSHGGVALDAGGFSRRVIPGFFTAVRMMLGPEFITGATHLCDGIADHITTDDPEDRWQAFRRSEHIQGVLFDTLIALSGYFKRPEKRLSWFVEIANSRLNRPMDIADEDSSSWRLTLMGAAELWLAVFSLLRMAADDPALWAVLMDRHGENDARDALDVVDQLSRFREELAAVRH